MMTRSQVVSSGLLLLMSYVFFLVFSDSSFLSLSLRGSYLSYLILKDQNVKYFNTENACERYAPTDKFKI